jgi:hypothetical protein
MLVLALGKRCPLPLGAHRRTRPHPGRGRRCNRHQGLIHIQQVRSVYNWGSERAECDWNPSGDWSQRSAVGDNVDHQLGVTNGAACASIPDSARAVLLVGHNPGLEELVADLGGVGWPMKTSSIAVLSSRFEWAEVGARLGKARSLAHPGSTDEFARERGS